jgi:hypothetical protein
MHLQAAGLEAERRARHVEAPDASARGADFGNGLVPVGLQVSNPGAQRERVMLAQALAVPHLEAGALNGGDNRADLVQLAVGKDVAANERPSADRGPTPGPPGDPVVQEAALRTQELV